MKNTYMIKKRGTFRYTFANGECYKGKYINVYISKFKRNNNAFAVCVSKKNGISVIRNKYKRWIREIYKEVETDLKNGLTIVVSFKKMKFEDIDYNLLKQDILKCFKELDLYENN